MASTGFAGGLAGGLEQGIGLKQRQQELDQMQQYRQAATDRATQQLGLQQQQSGLMAAKAAYDITSQELAQIKQQGIAAKQQGNIPALNEYSQQGQALQARQQDAATKLRSFLSNAQQGQQKIAGGASAADMDPHTYSNAISAQIGRPAIDLVDQPGKPSPIGQAVQTYNTGMQNMQQDNGQGVLDGVHGLFGHVLNPLVGQQTYDGSTVTGAQLAPPVPHATSPDHLHPMVQITTQHPTLGTGTQYVPMMQDMSHMLLHPEDASNGNVLNTNIHAITHQAAMMDLLHQAVNSDPSAVAALTQAHSEGATDNQQQMAANNALANLGITSQDWQTPEQQKYDFVRGKIKAGNPTMTDAQVDQATVNRLYRDPDTLTAYEKAALGLRANSASSAANKWQVATDKDGTPYRYNPVTAQATTLDGQPYTPKGFSKPSSGDDGGLNDDAVDEAVQSYIVDPTSLSRYGRKTAIRAQIMNGVAAWAKQNKIPASQLSLDTLKNKYAGQTLSTLQKTQALTKTYANTALQNFNYLGQLSSQVDRSGSPLLNGIGQAWNTKVVQDPKLAQFKNVLQETVAEYAKVVSGQTTGSAVSDAQQRAAENLLSSTDSPATFKAKLDAMRKVIGFRENSFQSIIDSKLASMQPKGNASIQGNAAQPASAGTPPLTNAQGWTLHKDAAGNMAYVSPDGKQFQAVQ